MPLAKQTREQRRLLKEKRIAARSEIFDPILQQWFEAAHKTTTQEFPSVPDAVQLWQVTRLLMAPPVTYRPERAHSPVMPKVIPGQEGTQKNERTCSSERGERSFELKFDAGRDPATGKRVIQYQSFKGTKREAQVKLSHIDCGG